MTTLWQYNQAQAAAAIAQIIGSLAFATLLVIGEFITHGKMLTWPSFAFSLICLVGMVAMIFRQAALYAYCFMAIEMATFPFLARTEGNLVFREALAAPFILFAVVYSLLLYRVRQKRNLW